MWGAGPGGPSTPDGSNPWSSQHQHPPQIGGQQMVHNLQQQQQQALASQSKQSNSWSLNPNHYTNIPHNQVDWAALAQQWMVLKGARGSLENSQSQHGIGMSMAQGMGGIGISAPQTQSSHASMFGNNSNPSNIVPLMHVATPFHHLGRSQSHEEGPPGVHCQGGDNTVTPLGDIIGEAPMELETLEQELQKPSNDGWKPVQNNWYAPEVNNPWSAALNNAAVALAGDQISSKEFGGIGVPYAASTPGHPKAIMKQKKNKASTVEYGYFNTQQARGPNSGYWSSHDDGSKDNSSGVAATVDSSLNIMESNVQHYTYSTITAAEYSSDDNSMPDMDAAKRKTLPVWIREGLEKMERQKKKKEEEHRLAAENEEMRKRFVEEQEAKAAADEDPQVDAQNSKWNQAESQPPSNDEESGDECEKEQENSGPNKVEVSTVASILKNLPPDEQDDAIMYAIRRVSTTLLVRLTNELIQDAASTSYNRAKSRKKVSSTMQIKRTSALASIAGGFGLGLGGYGSESDESSKSDAEDDNGPDEEKLGDVDSEEELIAEIEKKKRNWEMIKLELEHQSRSRSSSAVRSEVASSSQPQAGKAPNSENTVDLSGGSSKSLAHNSKEQREVDKPIVPNIVAGADTDHPRIGSNGIKQEDESDGKFKKISGKARSKSRSPKRRNRSRSFSKRRDRSVSNNTRSRRSRSRSSSRHADRKRRSSRSRSRSRSESRSRRRHRRAKSRSRSSDRSDSRSVYRGRNKSRSNSRNSRRSRSVNRRRQRTMSKSRSTSGEHRRKRSKDSRRKKSRSISTDKRHTSRSDSKLKDRKRTRSTSSSRVKHDKNNSSKSRRSNSKEKKKNVDPPNSSHSRRDRKKSRSRSPIRSKEYESKDSSSTTTDKKTKRKRINDKKEDGFAKPKEKSEKRISRSRSRSITRSRSRSVNSKTSDRSKPKDKIRSDNGKPKSKDKKSRKKDKKSRQRSRSPSYSS